MWAGKDPFASTEFLFAGLHYSTLIMVFITAHEFGHYFAARIHKVDATLPYYLPVPIIFGTMGAVIRIRSEIKDNKALFDIGIAGPLAGFVVCLAYLIIGFTHLPAMDFILDIHPENIGASSWPDHGLFFGSTILYEVLAYLLVSPQDWLPPMNEIYHYPWLCVGWFGMFVTALNMMPIGQLDGGHIAMAMFGKLQHKVGTIVWRLMFLAGVGGLLGVSQTLLSQPNPSELYMTIQVVLNWLQSVAPWWLSMWEGWIFWAVMVRVVIGIKHPELQRHEPLNLSRRILGWLSFLILVVSLSYSVIYEVPRSDGDLKIAMHSEFH